ncbi:PAS domain S-box protein [Microvirga terrestris]|uniref:Blue-light-activated histidine kinase n=1 Tax=Microvirga terrestris TaxID=2791024 RepID=A0ABS0HXW1_9HYPH|nr:PAS domain S-box protein [Microvirga terrestris]MBF9197972.1 PAS domain S-box protein [Microvirga terrestris]
MNRTSERNGFVAVPPAEQILDALAGPVAVLDQSGTIIAVNQAWRDFGRTNSGKDVRHVGTSYFDICDRTIGVEAACAKAAATGIRSVLAGQPAFSLEYPCHSPAQKRWFQLRASRLDHDGHAYAIVAHHDITDRVLVEQERQALLAKAHQHHEQLRALAAVSTRVAAVDSPEAIFDEITEQARLIIGAHWAATHTLPYALWPSEPVIVSVSDKYRDYPLATLAQNGAGIYSHVIQLGCPLRLSKEELSSHPDLQDTHFVEAHSLAQLGMLAVPVTGPQGGMLGVLMLLDKQNGEFTAADEAILIQLAQIASVSIENAVQARAERESRERLWATHEHAGVGIAETNAAGQFLTTNRGLSAIIGYSRSELLNLSIFDIIHPDDAEAEGALYKRQVAGELMTYSREKRSIRKDGSNVWLNVSSTAVFNEQGRFQYSVRVIQDIDERKRFEQRQALLVRELHHRVRNTLAVVQALATATSRTTTSIRDFNRSFSSRIAALAKTQTLLTEDYWQTAPLREMLQCELQPFWAKKNERFRLEGPDVNLSADLAIPLSMAIHELTANATRYGALSVRKGCVAVNWELIVAEGQRELHLKWVEQNGPPVEPPEHSGFGSLLLERILPAQCHARASLAFDPSGLQYEIHMPLITQRTVPEY